MVTLTDCNGNIELLLSIRFQVYNNNDFVSGTGKKIQEITRPNRITDLPEKLLMSGINLPGKWKQCGVNGTWLNN